MEQHHHSHTYHLTIDQKPYQWPEEFINGAQIKHLAGVTQPNYGVWRIVHGPGDDIPVADGERVQLSREHPDRNRFITGPVHTTEG